MPIMAMHAQSDARGAAWLLASIAKKYLSEPGQVRPRRDALNNALRLLEAYRTNVIFWPARPASRAGAETTDLLALPQTPEGHLEEVRDALDSALKASFSKESQAEALEKIKRVLQAVAYPDSSPEVSPDDRASVARFFEQLMYRLHVG